MTEEETRALRKAIAEHLQVRGPRDWGVLQAAYPGISHATFWRHVKAVRETNSNGSQGYEDAPKQSDSAVAPTANSYEAQKKIAHYEQLLAEVSQMCRQSKDATGKIVNWRMHAKSIEMRRQLLLEQAEVVQHLWDLGKMQDLYDAVGDEVMQVSPEIGQAVFDGLIALDAKRRQA